MLVLSRKNGERIDIGNNVSITVICVSGDNVRLGIDAPKDVLVLRHEITKKEPTGDTRTDTSNKSTVNGSHKKQALQC